MGHQDSCLNRCPSTVMFKEREGLSSIKFSLIQLFMVKGKQKLYNATFANTTILIHLINIKWRYLRHALGYTNNYKNTYCIR